MDVIHIIGFDLGHAITTVASVATNAGAALEILQINNKKFQTTALKLHYDEKTKGYKVEIGDRVFNKIEPNDEIFIAFKARPHPEPTYRRNMQEFYYYILQHFNETYQVPQWGDRIIILGCPSKWTKEERKAYQALFSDPKFPSPVVVSESRAAFLHAMEQKGTILTNQDLDGAILVIDIGSSTTDFTIIHGCNSEEPVYDFGDDLGASYFDEQIFKYSVEQNENAAQLRALLQANPNLIPRMMYRCRQAKENYFNAPDDFIEDYVPVTYERIGGVIFEPLVNGKIMKRFIKQTLANSQYSWEKTFKNHLEKAKSEIQSRGFSIKAVLLTGGASRMNFIRDSVWQIFPPDAGIKFQPDSEPEYSVAGGLARWGRRRYLIDSFLNEVKGVFEEEMPDLISKHRNQLLDILLPKLTDKVITDFAIPGLYDWKNGKYATIKILQNHIKKETDDWLQGTKGDQFLAEVSNEWWNGGVRQEFLLIIEPLCRQHEVPLGSMDLRFPFRPGSFSNNTELPMPIPLESLVRIIAYIVFWVFVVLLPVIGPIMALFITLLFKEGIDEFIDQKMQEIVIPGLARMTVTDKKIESVGKKQDEIASKMKQALLNNDTAIASITSQILDHLRTEVEQKANEASRLIQ